MKVGVVWDGSFPGGSYCPGGSCHKTIHVNALTLIIYLVIINNVTFQKLSCKSVGPGPNMYVFILQQ